MRAAMALNDENLLNIPFGTRRNKGLKQTAEIIDRESAAPDLLTALVTMNHMGGDERGGYCICPRQDGSAPDSQHATGCTQARAAIAKATA